MNKIKTNDHFSLWWVWLVMTMIINVTNITCKFVGDRYTSTSKRVKHLIHNKTQETVWLR